MPDTPVPLSSDPLRGQRILIVDDHPIVRHGIAQLLNREGDLECELQADCADAALNLLRTERVDLMIVDITMPHTEYAVATYYIIATAEASAQATRWCSVMRSASA